VNKQQQIEEILINLILQGNILPGERLPSIRNVAAQYGVSLTPVAEAFRGLEDREIVYSRPNSGYFVSEDVFTLPEFASNKRQKTKLLVDQFKLLNDRYSSYASISLNPANDISTVLGSAAASSYFYSEQHLYEHISRIAKEYVFQTNYQAYPKDDPELVNEIMKWMIPLKSSIFAEEISLTSSVLQAILLAVSSVTAPSGLVALEAPAFFGFIGILEFLKLRALFIPGDPVTGLDVSALEQALKNGARPDCLLVTSNFTNPTGALMPDRKKEYLVRLCRRYGVPIIEDDMLGEIYFGNDRPLPLKSFDNENVMYISGFGKLLAPSLRMAWIAGGRCHPQITTSKHLIGAFAPPLVMKGFAAYMKSGDAQKHMRSFRNKCREASEIYRDKIMAYFPEGTGVHPPEGGPYLWVSLPDGLGASELSDAARMHGVTIAPAQFFHAPESQYNCFRITCIATPWNNEVDAALLTVGNLAKSMLGPVKQ
jgi:DNA-binding transcriptional MocR family regulator